jgi:hypothetical protein
MMILRKNGVDVGVVAVTAEFCPRCLLVSINCSGGRIGKQVKCRKRTVLLSAEKLPSGYKSYGLLAMPDWQLQGQLDLPDHVVIAV